MKWINHHLPLFVVTSYPRLLNLCPPFRFVPVLLICHVSQNTVFAWLFIDVADLFPPENEIAPLNLITGQVALGNRDCSKTLAITLGLSLGFVTCSFFIIIIMNIHLNWDERGLQLFRRSSGFFCHLLDESLIWLTGPCWEGSPLFSICR